MNLYPFKARVFPEAGQISEKRGGTHRSPALPHDFRLDAFLHLPILHAIHFDSSRGTLRNSFLHVKTSRRHFFFFCYEKFLPCETIFAQLFLSFWLGEYLILSPTRISVTGHRETGEISYVDGKQSRKTIFGYWRNIGWNTGFKFDVRLAQYCGLTFASIGLNVGSGQGSILATMFEPILATWTSWRALCELNTEADVWFGSVPVWLNIGTKNRNIGNGQ